jgi:hypothetical protein
MSRPRLARPATSCGVASSKDVGDRAKPGQPGHDTELIAPPKWISVKGGWHTLTPQESGIDWRSTAQFEPVFGQIPSRNGYIPPKTL